MRQAIRGTSAFGIAVLAFLLHTATAAAELPDCDLGSDDLLGDAMRNMTLSRQVRHFMEVKGALKNGVELSFERDDPVLNVDLSVLVSSPAVQPTGDVTLKSSWALSPDFRFVKGRPIPYTQVATVRDGRRFGLMSIVSKRAALFLDLDGPTATFCNQAMQVKPDIKTWNAGSLSKLPDDVAFERVVWDEEIRSGSLRIIYVGSSAGAMNFQEVWVQGSRIIKSIARPFDQFAKAINIAGFDFQVIEARGDRVRMRYDIPERVEITEQQADKLPLLKKK